MNIDRMIRTGTGRWYDYLGQGVQFGLNMFVSAVGVSGAWNGISNLVGELNYSKMQKLAQEVSWDDIDGGEELTRRLNVNGWNDSNYNVLITGEDWNNYFRKKYGYNNVNWDTAFSSPNDIADMPSRVTDMNPEGLNWYFRQNGIETTPLGHGCLEGVPYESGGGFNAHYKSDYGATYVQYHPGGGHHGEKAYYKVSSGNIFSYSGKKTGTQRFYLNGKVIKNE